MHIGILDVVARAGLVAATSLLFAIILLAYLRVRSRKMLLLSAGFGVFFAHALLSVPELFNDAYKVALGDNFHLLIPLIGLVFILLGILKD